MRQRLPQRGGKYQGEKTAGRYRTMKTNLAAFISAHFYKCFVSKRIWISFQSFSGSYSAPYCHIYFLTGKRGI